MIDLMENSILGPVLRRGMAKGIAQGFDEGIARGKALGIDEGIARGKAQGIDEGALTGRRAVIEELLVAKFGPLPDWAADRLESANSEELHLWAKRILSATSIEETLRKS